jgi:pimeloyl-ACP methyl ester carboxylesterase
MPTITTSDSVRPHCTDDGDPAGRPIVLIAGLLAAATSRVYQTALLQDHAFDDRRDVIARVEVPVLFVAGAESAVWPSTHAAASAAPAHGVNGPGRDRVGWTP